ncbi:ATP-binding protein [Embleya scabrispora]|uniref:ATP-binding protein n=1 Tax=Embleya scabrispora TaxID=159449 RepID=UPI00099E9809|nr:ATP-binding protein [Embleya scabrispora]
MSIPSSPIAPSPTARLVGGLVLRPVPEAVGAGRAELSVLLATLHPEFDSADCVLMLSELVTNAVEHVKIAREWFINVLCWLDGDVLRIEVHDPGHGIPSLRDPGPEDCDGRGLYLVGAFSEDCGSERGPDGGTVAWFAVRLP